MAANEPQTVRQWIRALMKPLGQRVSLYQYVDGEFAGFLQNYAAASDSAEGSSSALRCYELMLKSFGHEMQEISAAVRALQALAQARCWPHSPVLVRAVDEIQSLERAKFVLTAEFQLRQKESLLRSCELVARVQAAREMQDADGPARLAYLDDWEELERLKAKLVDDNAGYVREKHRLNALITEQIEEIYCVLDGDDDDDDDDERI